MATEQQDLVAQVLEACNEVQDPCSLGVGQPMGIVDMGLVESVDVRSAADGRVTVDLTLTTTAPGCMYSPYFEQSVRRELAGKVSDLGDVAITWGDSTEWDESRMTPAGRARLVANRKYVAIPVEIADVRSGRPAAAR
ncbi:iron-sulfur cluster assembly protein [Nonomuraea sp. LP-02]|uniref:iron-sulfur cluster assembly protein n=1 Tax=Nonomuraea sp. LP-02 TaxID=3097960 RepID=UPI002E348014|nr:iron-sulfur cluster assembly protein [Nonomuraea sp. LP-02]MED7925972.1 iron-sulfur cluster assembly protein [Nonomuraea sp. LP-02]